MITLALTAGIFPNVPAAVRLALPLAVAALLLGSASATAAPVVHSTVTDRIRGPKVPQSFVGISDEYTTVPARTGNAQVGVNEPVVALFKLLARAGGGPPTYRIGGGTTDYSWYRPLHPATPRGAIFGITVAFVAELAKFVGETHSPLILGLNMGLNRPSLATGWAQAALAQLPGDPLFELGNEPNGFGRRMLDTHPPQRMRPRNYGPKPYLRELHKFLVALHRLNPRPRIAGPAIDAELDWVKSLPRLLRRERRRLSVVTVHRYPLGACGLRPGSRRYPRPRTILSDRTALEPLRLFQPVVAVARKFGKRVRMTETNSIACGGAKGASDTFASALWAADWLFGNAAIGMAGADIHAASPAYAPFVTGVVGGRWGVRVSPLFYGMLAFTETVGDGGRIMPYAFFTARAPGNGHIKVWAVRDVAKRQIRVLVLHKGKRDGTAFLRIPGAARHAQLKRLLAPSIASKGGVTWGGQHFATPSFDGALIGQERIDQVVRRRRSTFRVRMPAGSAALLTVAARQN